MIFRRIDQRWPGVPYALLRRSDTFGIVDLDLAAPPSRFFADVTAGGDYAPPVIRHGVDEREGEQLPSLATRIGTLGHRVPAAISRAMQAKLAAWFLISEDRHARLVAQKVQTLAHQASLVHYILETPDLQRVLIGDEVGLGKTVEAGLLIRNLLERDPRLRVLYLSPARLVDNVRAEFDLLGLGFRTWRSDGDASLAHDSRVIASINRAAHELHRDTFAKLPAWDVLVVDECHHLSNYDPDGHEALSQYRLVADLIERMPPGARLILMSGTPHQGHPDRFRNLLRLLTRPGEPTAAGAQRVIYRTKEDVRDWDGNPLFPARQVNPPLVLQGIPEDWYDWLRGIHAMYTQAQGGNARQRRAGAWRASQALQWASSSFQAGMAYLARAAIRAGWSLDDPALQRALCSLRPYRLGRHDASAEQVAEQMGVSAVIIESEAAEPRIDDPDQDEGPWCPPRDALLALLEQGSGLLERHRDAKWEEIHDRLIAGFGNDQAVLFAQPVETVCALADYLQRRTGQRPAIIIGGMSRDELRREQDRFWRGEARFLIGSRAAYEGFNLQCAHRVIHVDVPWNPMDLEQRVGRVHRFGSRQTVVVDTIVLGRSREAEAYGTAFNRLSEIAGALARDPQRMQMLFARVMCLVPPEELQRILAARAVDGLSAEERAQIGDLVQSGMDAWNRFNASYGANVRAVRSLAPGAADWSDLERLLRDHAGAEVQDGFSAHGFIERHPGVVEPSSGAAPVVRLVDHGLDLDLVCQDVAGRLVCHPDGREATPVGLNTPVVAALLRRLGFPAEDVAVAILATGDERDRVQAIAAGVDEVGLIFAARTSVRFNEDGRSTELEVRLHAWRIGVDGRVAVLPPEQIADAVRLIGDLTPRRTGAAPPWLGDAVRAWEGEAIPALCRRSQGDVTASVRHTVFPLGVCWIA